ncbi:retinitis pigmentosa 1-like 1 protein [Manacus candei]|uniref:retinitis pigmentosa 1-like 1 protein n=1 Tax=Manacus candei TaxID=415023 RepID=UPI0022275AF7|nr:retinitis pigmentosa 1-like 1 protein [Manacus candei]
MSQVPADLLSTTSSYNYEPPLPSVARASALTQVPPAKKITFFKSGDPQFAGVKMAINQRSFKSFNALMDDLSHRVPLPFGVRTITTPRGIHCISELDQLEDGGCYLCSDKKYVKPIGIAPGGHRPAPPRHARPSSTMRRAAQESKLEDYSTPFTHHGPRIPKKITLVKNGESGFRRSIILNRRNARSFKTLLDEITEILQFPVKKLYTVDGKKIDSMQALLHCPNVLVCVGREPFKPVSMENLRKHSVEKLPNLPPCSNGNNVNENNESKQSSGLNFGLKAKKSVIHPRSSSSNRSMRFSLSSEKSYPNGLAASPDNGAPFSNGCSHPKAGELVQSLVNDDIEKRVHVNKDGSLSVEMKVRFRLLNDETLQWSTQIKKSNLLNRLPCEESEAEEDSGVDPLQKMNPEVSSEADDSLYPCEIDSYMSKLEESECDEAHCHSCGKKHQDYDIWKNPMHTSQREEPSVRSTWRTRSSCSSTSSRRRVVHKKITSVDSLHTTSSEEFSEHIVRESSSYSETIENRVAYRSVKKCRCRSDLSTGASIGEDQQGDTRASTGNGQRPSSVGLMSHSSCENNLDTQDTPEDHEISKTISQNEEENCFEASSVKGLKDDVEEAESSRVGSVMSKSSLQSKRSKNNVCEETSSVGRSMSSSSSLQKANQGENSRSSTPANSVHSKSSNCTTQKAKSEQDDQSDENPVVSSLSTDHATENEIRNGKPTSSSSRVSSKSEVKDKFLLAQVSQETDERRSQSNMSQSSKSRQTKNNNLRVKMSNSSRASLSESTSVHSLHCPAPPKGKPKRRNMRPAILKNSSVSSVGTKSVLSTGKEQKEIVDSSKETSYGSRSAAPEVNDQNNKETDDSCKKKAEEASEDTGVQEEGSDLMPSALPNTSPEEVVQEWLRKIPSESLLEKYEMEDDVEEEGTETATEVSHCTHAEEAPEDEKAEEKNEEEAENEAKAEVEGETAEDTAINEEVEECVNQEEVCEVATEAAKAEQAESNQSVTSSQNNNRRDLPTSVQTSVQIMKALLSSKHETKFDRSNSLPEVSPTMGRKLSNSANILITCLASLQLLDEESEDPSDNSKALNKSRYTELLNIFQALWLGCTAERSGPSSGQEASEQAKADLGFKGPKSMDHAFTHMSSSGVDVCSGSGGSGEECPAGATLVAQKTAEFKSAEVENTETGTEVTEVEEQSKEGAQPSRPSTACSDSHREEKAQSAKEESLIQEEGEKEEDQCHTCEHGQEEGGENENEETSKLAETGEQEEAGAVNDELPQENPEATTDDANVNNADAGTEIKADLEGHLEKESPSDPEPKVCTSTSVGTSVVRQKSVDPDPVWVLRLLKKIEKEFMAHYVNAMNELKVRWNLQDNQQMDEMIQELKEEVSKRIQKSIEKELRKIRSRAGTRVPRPPDEPLTLESKLQTEQRRWRLQTMHKKSLFGGKNGNQSKLEETTELSLDVDKDLALSAAFDDSISKQSSEEEYCPCDSCVRKKMASKPQRLPVVATNAPVMKAFDLQQILRLKKDDKEEAIVAETAQDIKGEPQAGEEVEDNEEKEPEVNELNGDGEEPEIAETQKGEGEDEVQNEETKEDEAEEAGEETKEGEEEEKEEEEIVKAEEEEEIKEEEEEGETKEDEEVKEEEAEEKKEEEELNEEEGKEEEEEVKEEEEEEKEEETKEEEEEVKEEEEEAKEEEEEEEEEGAEEEEEEGKDEEEEKEEEEEAKEEEEEVKEEEEEAKEEEEEAKEGEEEVKEDEEEAKEEEEGKEEEEEAKEEEEEVKEEEEAKEEEEGEKEEEETKEEEEEANEEEEEQEEETQNEEQEAEEKSKGEDEAENEAEETEEPEDDEAETSECRGDAKGSGTDNNPGEDDAEGNEEAEQDEAEAVEDAKPESEGEAEEENDEGGEKHDENEEEPANDDPDKAHEKHEGKINNKVSQKVSRAKGKKNSKKLESLKASTAFSYYSSVGNFSQQSQKGSEDKDEGEDEEEDKDDHNPGSDPPNGEIRSDESSKPSQMYPESEEEEEDEDKDSSGTDAAGDEDPADAEGADPKEAENTDGVQASKKKENSDNIDQEDLDF